MDQEKYQGEYDAYLRGGHTPEDASKAALAAISENIGAEVKDVDFTVSPEMQTMADEADQYATYVGRIPKDNKGLVGGTYDFRGSPRGYLNDNEARFNPDTKAFLEQNKNTTLGDLLQHDALFDLYPELKDVTVHSFRELYGERSHALHAGFIPKTNQMVFNFDNIPSEFEFGQALLHETQHAVQNLDKKAGLNVESGSNTTRAVENFKGNIESYVSHYGEESLDDVKWILNQIFSDVGTDRSAHELYETGTGEAEARVTQENFSRRAPRDHQQALADERISNPTSRRGKAVVSEYVTRMEMSKIMEDFAAVGPNDENTPEQVMSKLSSIYDPEQKKANYRKKLLTMTINKNDEYLDNAMVKKIEELKQHFSGKDLEAQIKMHQEITTKRKQEGVDYFNEKFKEGTL